MRRAAKLNPRTDIVAFLKHLDPATRRRAIELLSEQERDALDRAWHDWAHPGQLAPKGDWATWVIKAGRGFGKTLAGAQWIVSQVARPPHAPLRIALVGASLDEARKVMVEGRSGLLAVGGEWIEAWRPTQGRLRFRTGAEAALFSGASPHLLRGPEHHYAWCDELAKWPKPQESWDMLQLGLRLGSHPCAVVTTTPRPGPVLRSIIDAPDTVVTGGPTRANPHLARRWRDRVEALYGGTRLGRQELDGELLSDAPGALWTVELIEKCRVKGPSPSGEGLGWGLSAGCDVSGERQAPSSPLQESGIFVRTLIAVDPPSGDGTCGIVACARDAQGIAHVLADHSVTARSPEGWARAVAAAAAAHTTREVIAEANQGGRMVRAVLLTADPALRVRLVNARLGKSLRAEPVAHLCESGRVRLHGRMSALEAELLGMIAGGGYEGPGRSPDRADAMVWGVGEVMREWGVRVSLVGE